VLVNGEYRERTDLRFLSVILPSRSLCGLGQTVVPAGPRTGIGWRVAFDSSARVYTHTYDKAGMLDELNYWLDLLRHNWVT
jgi:hypothetical protein